MDARWRTGLIFAAGSLAGAALAVWAYVAWIAPGPPGGVAAVSALPAPLAASDRPAETADTQAAATAPAALACAFEPAVAQSQPGDGQFALHAALANHRGGDHEPFLAVAEEASVQGRVRDAEVALIAACRIAASTGAQSVPVAQVQTRLAQHYTAVAARVSDAPARGELVQRADELLARSVDAYAAALGKEASRTRLAAQRLAAFRVGAPMLAAGAAANAGGLPGAEPSAAADMEYGAASTASLGASSLSLADRPPRQSEDVGQLDSDLDRLLAQARSVSRDPAGVQRRHEQAMAQRQACRGDEGCLRNWYAQRRRQLFAEF